LLIASVFIAAAVAPAHGQKRSAVLFGWVRDSTGSPIPFADVEIAFTDAWSRSDTLGRFSLRALDPGKVTVNIRRLGFAASSFDLTLHPASTDSVSVVMNANPRVLAAMRSDASLERRYIALEGFYRRRSLGGSGTFLSREEIESHHTTALSGILREVPGLRIVRAGTARSGVRFQSSNAMRRDCPPQYWLDGRRMNGAEIDDFPASDVEAIELYSGPSSTPVQFSQSASQYTCGTVVIWTRIPGS
jgi:hypothetical protein